MPETGEHGIPPGGGSGLILVIEDEPGLREAVKGMLQPAGFTVLTAPDGPSALAIVRQHCPEFRAVLLDLGLPGMTGQELFREIHRLCPTPPVILMTGLPEADARAGVADLPVAGYLQKPFYPTAFLRTVRAVVEGGGQALSEGKA